MTDRAPSPADVATELESVSRRLVERARRWPARKWTTSRGSERSVAAAVQALVTSLARLEHAVAIGAAERPAAWRSPAPPAYPSALPDRLAVVSNDLVAALRAAPAQHQVWYADELVPIATLAAAAVAQVGATAAELP